MKDGLQFLDGVKREFGKVVWPSRAELVGSTIVVLALVTAFALYLGALDFMFAKLAEKVLSL